MINVQVSILLVLFPGLAEFLLVSGPYRIKHPAVSALLKNLHVDLNIKQEQP